MAIAEYFDWSDRGLELRETGSQNRKWVDVDFSVDDDTNDIMLHLRRDTKHKKDLMVVVPDDVLKRLYQELKLRFED